MDIYIGGDPGERNFGYSVFNFVSKNDLLSINIHETGMITDTITNLTFNEFVHKPKTKLQKAKHKKNPKPYKIDPGFNAQYVNFIDCWADIFEEYKPNKVTVERFQTRGLLGKSIECVSLMNGTICALADEHGCNAELIIASSWKNTVNSFLSVIDLELEDLYKMCRLTPHTIDSCFIGIHGALRFLGKDWNNVNISAIVKELQDYEFVA